MWQDGTFWMSSRAWLELSSEMLFKLTILTCAVMLAAAGPDTLHLNNQVTAEWQKHVGTLHWVFLPEAASSSVIPVDLQALGLPTALTPYCVDGLLRQSSTGEARWTCVPGIGNFTFDTLVHMFEIAIFPSRSMNLCILFHSGWSDTGVWPSLQWINGVELAEGFDGIFCQHLHKIPLKIDTTGDINNLGK